VAEGGAPKDACLQDDPMEQDEVSDSIAAPAEETRGASEGPVAEGGAPKDACLQYDPMEHNEVPLVEAHSDSIVILWVKVATLC
jgi:hypothetical protein